MKKLKKFGFTLVELIIVVTILIILISIGTLKFRQYPGQARDAVRAVDLKQIEQALEFYALKHGDYPTPEADGTIGEQTYSLLEKLNKLPLDPSGEKYTYKLLNGEPVLGAKFWETYIPDGREGSLKTKNDGGTNLASQGPSDSSGQTNTQTSSKLVINYTFTEVKNQPLGTVNNYYIQSVTNLKWDSESINSLKWAKGNTATEPVWNGNQYDFEKELANNKRFFINPDSPDNVETIFHYCRKKGSKWRVPTKNELLSIVNYHGANSSGKFSNLKSITGSTYLSSTIYDYTKSNIWTVNFTNGKSSDNEKKVSNNNIYVVCVHD